MCCPVLSCNCPMKTVMTLKVYSSIEEATLAKDYLAEHGVSAMIRVDETAGMHPSANAKLAILVEVEAEDLQKAQELLQIT
jgi:hypothetical protein